jgi:hypothetical protein
VEQIKPFAQPDRDYTRLHNSLFDVVMPTLKPNAWKLLCFILRKTNGWNKTEAQLSYNQLRAGTGIQSDATLSATIKELADAHYILVTPIQWQSSMYELNYQYIVTDTNQPGAKEEQAQTTTKTVATTEIEDATEIEGTSKTVVPPTSISVVPPTTEIEDIKRKVFKEKEKESEYAQPEAPQPATPSPLPLSAPSSTSTGDRNMDAAKAKFERGGRVASSWQAELNLELSEKIRVPLAKELARVSGWEALINAGDDGKNRECHEAAIYLYKMGIGTPADLKDWYAVYLSDPWHREKNANPKPEKVKELISKKAQAKQPGMVQPKSNNGNGKPAGVYVGVAENLK